MDTQYEIRFTPTHKMLAENVRKYGAGPRIPTVIVCSALFAAVILYLCVAGFWKDLRGFVITLLIVEIVVFFLPHIMAGLRCGTAKKLNNGKVFEAIITVSENIEYTEGPWNARYEFVELTGAVRLKYSYKLRFTERRSLLIDPNSFTKGTFEEFKQFLREKRPDLVIPE